MIVTDKFVFVHMHKTGGQALNDVIRRCIPGHRDIGYHYPLGEVPAESAHLPIVGIIRNPWDWYVSWYAFNRRPQINNPLFNVVSDSGLLNFKSTVKNLVNLGADSAMGKRYRGDLVRLLPERLDGNKGAGLTRDSIEGFVSDDTGYYSWLAERMLGDIAGENTFIGHFENLQEDFLATMRTLAVPETEYLAAELDQQSRKNVSHHSHYSHYYDDELRDLVGQKERALIDRFEYEFEAVKPAGVSYEFPADMYAGANGGFRKLLGRDGSYLKLCENFDIAALKQGIERLPAEKWLESERERLFAVHKHTQSAMLVRFEDFKHEKPVYDELYFELEDALKPLIDYVKRYYGDNGFVVRLLLAKLLAGGKIPHHTDAGFSLLNCHRVHVPLITSDDIAFFVGGVEINMKAGEFWEINNSVDHAVENRSDEDRIHVIIDWMPNFGGLPQEKVLTPPDAQEPGGKGVPAETLNAMIAEAYQVHRAGQVARAESLYRQVLNLDPGNVVANNLFGLLCLQTKRFDDSARFIRKALAGNANDAQAHANLALALRALRQPEDAARHFHESLKLNAANPGVYNNLGGVYIELGRIDDAIRCYQQALAIQPALAEAHFNLGSALLLQQRYGEAAASLQQCVAMKPDFTEGRAKLREALSALSG